MFDSVRNAHLVFAQRLWSKLMKNFLTTVLELGKHFMTIVL